MTVTGAGFGSAPAPQPASKTTCGDYSDNGFWYGPAGLYFHEPAQIIHVHQGLQPAAAEPLRRDALGQLAQSRDDPAVPRPDH